MSKHYKDYTVGELIEMGASIDVWFHETTNKFNQEQAEEVVSKFDGLPHKDNDEGCLRRSVEDANKFEVYVFIREDDE